MKFDRVKFFNGFRKWRGEITSQQVKGLNFLLDAVEIDRFVNRIDWFAYMLATTMIETAYTFLPIHEYGGKAYFIRRYGSQTKVGRRLGNDTPEEGAIYAGRGDVQLTGEDNYERAEIALRREYPELITDFEKRTGKKFDLTVGDQPNDLRDPDNAQDPAIAYAIMSFGMRTGMFTGRKLSDYFSPARRDPLHARKIINGMDNAEKFHSAFLRFEAILKDTYIGNVVAKPIETKVLEVEEAEDINKIHGEELSEAVDTPNYEENTLETSETNSNQSVNVGVTDGNIKVEQSDKQDDNKEKTAIEKTEPKNFLDKIKLKLYALTGGNIGLQTLRETSEQFQFLGLSAKFWFWITTIAIVGAVIYLASEYYKHWSDTHRDLSLTNKLIDANSTPNNFVQLIPKDEIDDYKKRGYKIITR